MTTRFCMTVRPVDPQIIFRQNEPVMEYADLFFSTADWQVVDAQQLVATPVFGWKRVDRWEILFSLETQRVRLTTSALNLSYVLGPFEI